MNFRLHLFILVCSLAPSGGALGETPPDAAPESRQAEEEIVVTGSRVPRKDLNAPGPVVVYDRDDIAASGVASVGESMRLLSEYARRGREALSRYGLTMAE